LSTIATGRLLMKKLLPIGIAALSVLSASAAHAQLETCGPAYSRPCTDEDAQAALSAQKAAEDEPNWYFEKWNCSARMSGVVTLKDIPAIMENIRNLKRHCAWLQCLDDRAARKVKHCYANDRRWR
jgi:hypothetical protein